MIRELLARALPNLSNSMNVAWLRHVQSIHEAPEHRNPDTLVTRLLPTLERWRASRLDPEALSRLRTDGFYYFLVARTRYYDQVITDAVRAGARRVINIGSGSDTRAHRFEPLLQAHGASVLECDQPNAIGIKRQLVKGWKSGAGIRYLPIDLNDGRWPTLESFLAEQPAAPTLVLMEGVSPYIDEEPFAQFLRLLAASLTPSSQIAYDFKYSGVNDAFGLGGRTRTPYRQSTSPQECRTFHENLGFRVEELQSGAELTTRLLPTVAHAGRPLFQEDGLIRLQIGRMS